MRRDLAAFPGKRTRRPDVKRVQRFASTATITLEGVGRRVLKLGPEQPKWVCCYRALDDLQGLTAKLEYVSFDVN